MSSNVGNAGVRSMLADIGEFIPNVSTTARAVRAHLVWWDRLWELATSNWQSGQINRPCSFSQVSDTLPGSNLWAFNVMWCSHIVGATSSGQPSTAHCFLFEMMCISGTALWRVSDSIIPNCASSGCCIWDSAREDGSQIAGWDSVNGIPVHVPWILRGGREESVW